MSHPQETALTALVAKIRQDPESRRAAVTSLFQLEGCDFEAAHACLGLRKQAILSQEDLAPCTPILVDRWQAIFGEIAPAQVESDSHDWMFEQAYARKRAYAGLLLDLLGYVPKESTVPALERALMLKDPRLKCWTIVSLIRHGCPVKPDDVLDVTESDEVRLTLWNEFRKLKSESLMPAEWTTPENLAASSLTSWAGHPNEFGTPPQVVEAVQGFIVDDVEGHEGEELIVYLFRFGKFACSSIPAEDRFAGIAGPFHDGEELDSPWSNRTRWEALPPDEHFDRMYYRSAPMTCGPELTAQVVQKLQMIKARLGSTPGTSSTA